MSELKAIVEIGYEHFAVSTEDAAKLIKITERMKSLKQEYISGEGYKYTEEEKQTPFVKNITFAKVSKKPEPEPEPVPPSEPLQITDQRPKAIQYDPCNTDNIPF